MCALSLQRDQWGNLALVNGRPMELKLETQHPDTRLTVTVRGIINALESATKRHPGTFLCTIAGVYRVFGSLDGLQIGVKTVLTTPSVTVIAGATYFPDARVSGPGLLGTQFGFETSFRIDSVDR